MSQTSGKGRLAILTSGGDAPGMNAAIRAATLVGIAKGWDVLGVRQGYKGLLADTFEELTPQAVLPILREGGTMLGSARCKEFMQPAVRDKARVILRKRGIDGLVVIGGNGSLTGALALTDPEEARGFDLKVVGIPASIDNDLALTSICIGVDTAMNTIVEAVDKITDTASAHDRTFIVEVMGRDCGYLAMTSAIASGADMVLFPEAQRSEQELVDSVVNAVLSVRKREQRNRRVIAIKAEGINIPTERLKKLVDAKLETSGGGGGAIETRVTVLGHVVRGGRPSAFDRLLGSRLANVAVRAIMEGRTRVMTSWMPPQEIPPEIGARSLIDPYCYLVDLPATIAATEKLLTGQSPLARWRASVMGDLEDVLLL